MNGGRYSQSPVRLVGLLLASVALPVIADAATPPPNIVFILIDDMGWTDVGCFGSKYYETPRIDQLCREGMKFTNAYTCGPNCAPTRACLMSGQYAPRHGVYTVRSGARGLEKFRKLIPVENNSVLPPKTHTIAEALKGAGYATCHMGKWHLGTTPESSPTAQGFDVTATRKKRGHFTDDGEYLTDRFTDLTLKFIDDHHDEPFFVYLAHFAVHTPIQAKSELTAKYEKKPASGSHRNPVYAAMIESVDQSVGRILDKLEALQLTEKTIVVFSSDNGGLGGYARAGIVGGQDVSDNKPLRGGKGMLYEGGIRVPLIVRWPGVVKPQSVCKEPVLTVDFYPTLVEVGGGAVKKEQRLDGLSLMPLLSSDGSANLTRAAIYWHFPGYLQADEEKGTWRTRPVGAVRSGDYKLLEFFEDGRLELYNLKDDIGEEKNLAPTMRERTRELHTRLKTWRASVGAPMPRRKGEKTR